MGGLERRREALNGEIATVQARLESQRRDLADITARLARERSEGGQAIPTAAPEGAGRAAAAKQIAEGGTAWRRIALQTIGQGDVPNRQFGTSPWPMVLRCRSR